MEAVNSLDLSQIGGLTFVVPKVNQILGYGISNGKILALFAVISLIGIITLFVLNRKNKINLVLLSALVLFVPLLFWNPLATPILQQILPTWGIQRVMSIDLLSIVALPAGIVGIVMAWNYVTRKARRLSMDPAAIMVLVSILVVLIFQPMLYFNRSEVFSAEGKDHLLLEYPVNINIPESIDRAAWMFEWVNQGTVLTGDQYQNYFIPAWTHLKALDYTQLDGDPSFLTTKSYLCWDYLVHNFDSQELELSGVDYVYTTKGSTLYEIVMDNEKYFQAIRDDGMYFLFQLDLGDGKITMSEDARCDL
jgi:hypothetical protein